MRSVNVPGDLAFEKYHIDGAREHDGLMLTAGQIGAVHGDMATQLAASLDAVADLLVAAGCTLDDLLRIGIFTTDMDAFIAQFDVVRDRFAPNAVPPHTVVQVQRLANPCSLVEIEATASRAPVHVHVGEEGVDVVP